MNNDELIIRLKGISEQIIALTESVKEINRKSHPKCPVCNSYLNVTKLFADQQEFKLEECSKCEFKNEEGNIK